jgi:hypothetical protein
MMRGVDIKDSFVKITGKAFRKAFLLTFYPNYHFYLENTT